MADEPMWFEKTEAVRRAYAKVLELYAGKDFFAFDLAAKAYSTAWLDMHDSLQAQDAELASLRLVADAAKEASRAWADWDTTNPMDRLVAALTAHDQKYPREP